MPLSKRLSSICLLLDHEADIADIGADHGEVVKYIALRNPNNSFLAIENKLGPFKRLRNNLLNCQNATCLLSDGLKDVSSNYAEIVIAGMGGENIISIIKRSIEKIMFINAFIIDAHSDFDKVYNFLFSLNFKIDKSIFVYENNKAYLIAKFIKNSTKQVTVNSHFMFYEIDSSSEEYLHLLKSRLENELSLYLESIKDKILIIDENAIRKFLLLERIRRRLLNEN